MKKLIDQDPLVRRVALSTPAGFLAFGFGSGLFRHAPGTMGTVAAIPFALVLKILPETVFWIVLASTFLAGIHICGVSSKRLGRHDPGGIVWDEMVAYWLTVAFLPMSWGWWLAAFLLFRFFDIVKPWPIRQLEKRFGGGLGIMLDDVIAAVFAMVILAAAARFI
ncbi:MAG: phosphatidylglycerophosphatase A [Xanthomonadales bacterium]|nr:phosphatidylglycerophosphatase A [Gammaproteobacteria bacterium]MBT8052600.1 phosphatidylglycerophosphatase A [Gammaproteobacteria bacterium]NND56641.1 phosphatidylglycerophosphatase A [Xanthomonadales bacterium]NNK52417.1 phosphatidylglycerophosphatase A [Xanthomonadales bacterium]